MKVIQHITPRLYEDADLQGVPRPVIVAVAEAALRYAAAYAPAGFELAEADAADVAGCEGSRCHNFIDPQEPGDAHHTPDGWVCDACWVEAGEALEDARDRETSRRTDKS